MGLDCHDAFIVHLARLVKPKLFVKLGLFQCALFNQIIPYAEKSIGVDMHPDAGKYMKQSGDIRFVKGTTQEFAKELEVKPLRIDMLVIDANHFKEVGRQDFHEFVPFMAPHGLILLDDSYPTPDNSDLKKPGLFEFMPILVSPGLTICRKRQEQLAW